MSNLNHLFVPCKLALEARKKGFDEPCLGWYNLKQEFLNQYRPIEHDFDVTNTQLNELKGLCAAPIYQQLVDWLESKHGFFFERLMNDDKQVYCVLWNGAAGYVELQTLDKAIEQAFKLI